MKLFIVRLFPREFKQMKKHLTHRYDTRNNPIIIRFVFRLSLIILPLLFDDLLVSSQVAINENSNSPDGM